MADKPTILVVDDDLAALELVSHTLAALGTEPKCLQSSRPAAELIQKEKFDGVFLDWLMPEMDGLELARRIRSSKSNKRVPIVMLTANTEPEAMERAFQAGVNFFLTKPATADKVKKLLESSRGMILAERRRYQRAAVGLAVLCTWKGERIAGTAVNLSSSGVLLRVQKVAPEGASVTVGLTLPERAKGLELGGIVARIVEGIGMAVKFTGHHAAERQLLADFVARTAEAQPAEKVF